MGCRRHAETGCAESDSGRHQHDPCSVSIGETTDEGDQQGAEGGAGQVEDRNAGAGQTRVLDYRIDEYGEYVGLTRPGAEHNHTRRGDDKPPVKDAVAGLAGGVDRGFQHVRRLDEIFTGC